MDRPITGLGKNRSKAEKAFRDMEVHLGLESGKRRRRCLTVSGHVHLCVVIEDVRVLAVSADFIHKHVKAALCGKARQLGSIRTIIMARLKNPWCTGAARSHYCSMTSVRLKI